jgi:uncharacterized protein YdeI (YjbR/CyaY-like superfamily)
MPDPRKIKTFRAGAAFESWKRKNHARSDEVWLRIYKKDSGMTSVTIAGAGRLFFVGDGSMASASQSMNGRTCSDTHRDERGSSGVRSGYSIRPG